MDLGNPMDGLGSIKTLKTYEVSNTPPNPLKRKVIKEPLSLGVKAIDGMLTCGKGQRIGIYLLEVVLVKVPLWV